MIKKYPNIEHVLESTTVSQSMIKEGLTKQEVLAYLNKRNHTEDIANNIANTALDVLIKYEIKEEKKVLLGGVAMFLIGLGITFGTYQYAESGGTYVVTYGIVIYGLFLSLKSLSVLGELRTKEKTWKTTQ
ncbi:MAG: hypothetical protein FAF03_06045 [Epsilonproteobacteria bacterium]|nr:hypothetical protein [Campylobacterota bacterium]